MREIRARITKGSGLDISNQQIQELAARRLEAILDPRTIKPALLEQLRRGTVAAELPAPAAPAALEVKEESLFDSFMRRLFRPLFATLASAFFLKEAVGPARAAALAVGFLGVLIVTNPGAETFQIGALYALANAILFGTVTAGVRGMTTTESAGTLTIYQLAILTVTVIEEDPIYLTQPNVVSRTWEVDPRGTIPPFTQCNSVTEIPRYRHVTEETLDYMLRELRLAFHRRYRAASSSRRLRSGSVGRKETHRRGHHNRDHPSAPTLNGRRFRRRTSTGQSHRLQRFLGAAHRAHPTIPLEPRAGCR